MSQNKHTPGPWIVTTCLRQDDEIICDMLNEGAYVAITKGQKLANWRHDASLIAAAPLLLDALDKMLDNEEQRAFEKWLRDKTPSGDVSDVQAQWLESSYYEDFLEDWAIQISAIAKARGDQP